MMLQMKRISDNLIRINHVWRGIMKHLSYENCENCENCEQDLFKDLQAVNILLRSLPTSHQNSHPTSAHLKHCMKGIGSSITYRFCLFMNHRHLLKYCFAFFHVKMRLNCTECSFDFPLLGSKHYSF